MRSTAVRRWSTNRLQMDRVQTEGTHKSAPQCMWDPKNTAAKGKQADNSMPTDRNRSHRAQQWGKCSPHDLPFAGNHSVQSSVTGIMKQASGQAEKDFSFFQRVEGKVREGQITENSLQMRKWKESCASSNPKARKSAAGKQEVFLLSHT